MIKFVIFNNASRAAEYGIGTYINNLYRELVRNTDINVVFVDMQAATKEFEIMTDEQGCMHYKSPLLRSGAESESYCRSVFYYLVRNIKVEDGDRIVFQFNYFQHLPIAALLKAYFPNCQIVLTVHYFLWCFDLNGNQMRLEKLLAQEIESCDEKGRHILKSIEEEKEFLCLADEVIVLSKWTKSILKDYYKINEEKMKLIYNGLGQSILPHEISTRDVLFVGRLDKIKGLKYLIKAFRIVAAKHYSCNLIIAGDGDFGPYLAECRELKGRVSFMGKLSREDLDSIYHSAYIGVIPSFHEQCSYTVIEMMRHGIPVIGTDSTGLSEMLDATPDLRVSAGVGSNWEEVMVTHIAVAIDRLLSDENEYLNASNAVRDLYWRRYTSLDMVSQTIQLCKKAFVDKKEVISKDYLRYLDKSMMRLIDQRPDIDLSYYGLAGIGVYLWWRIKNLECEQNDEYSVTLLQEFMIYYVDWLVTVWDPQGVPHQILAVLLEMSANGFYKTRVRSLLRSINTPISVSMPEASDIIVNALKIKNCKI